MSATPSGSQRILADWKFTCPNGHEAEMWFIDQGEYDRQHELTCGTCCLVEHLHGVDG